MTNDIVTAIRSRGSAASHIAALCEVMVAALAADPDTEHLGQAIEGLGALAGHLSSDLFALADRAA